MHNSEDIIDPHHSMSKQKILPVEPLIQCEAGRAKTIQRQSLYSPRTPKWPPSDKGELTASVGRCWPKDSHSLETRMPIKKIKAPVRNAEHAHKVWRLSFFFVRMIEAKSRTDSKLILKDAVALGNSGQF